MVVGRLAKFRSKQASSRSCNAGGIVSAGGNGGGPVAVTIRLRIWKTANWPLGVACSWVGLGLGLVSG